MKVQVGEEILFDGAMYRVVQITEMPKDGSKKVVLQEVIADALPKEPVLHM